MTPARTREDGLAAEARAFHRAFFPGEPPQEVVRRYIEANLRFETEEADRAVAAVVRAGLDVEAVEFWLRLRGRNPALTRKIQVLFYLLEPRSRYYPWFVGGAEGRAKAVRGLIGAALRSVWKGAKGAWLVRRHGIV